MIRFHHDIVLKIHPFANGNGRHARMITDVIALKHGQPEFPGAREKILLRNGARAAAYLAALRALDANENDVKLLLEFASS